MQILDPMNKINNIFLFETELLLLDSDFDLLYCPINPRDMGQSKEILLTVTKRYQKKNIEREERGG